MNAATLGWPGIVRLGLVQTALGAIVVLTTSTMNRVMVVELALPAMLPGALVAFHNVLQMLRPRMGHGSDVGGRRTPWIVGGMAVLAAGGVLAALAIAWMQSQPAAGIALAILAFGLIGLGSGAAGTGLLVLLAKCVAPERRAAAATTTWVMMICGFIVTTAVVGQVLDPYTPARLVTITAVVGVLAVAVTLVAVWGVERDLHVTQAPVPAGARPRFMPALREVLAERETRRFTLFIFASMLAYSMQDLILEPYAGLVFGFTPGQSTALASVQHGGVLAGMIALAVGASVIGGRWLGPLRHWIVGGCLASAAALLAIAAGAAAGPGWPLREVVFALGFGNGAFAIAAIAAMMSLASQGTPGREGLRMGLWGGTQAVAFALGGFAGAAASDAMRWLLGSVELGYGSVFLFEAGLFLWAAWLAAHVALPRPRDRRKTLVAAGGYAAAGGE
ncbi:MAG: BCD family MFS transporter [Betaproteobacteria bacterium]